MRNLFVVLSLICSLNPCLTWAADNKPLENTEFQVFKAQTELKFEAIRDIQQKAVVEIPTTVSKLIDTQGKTIDAFDKRIADLNLYIALASIIITVLAIFATFVGYSAAASKAKKIAEDWFKENENGLLARLKILETDLANKASLAHSAIDVAKQSVIDKGAEVTKNMTLNTLDATTKVSADDKTSLTAADTALKDKPESQYTFNDWNTRAHAAYANGSFVLAANFWDQASQTSEATDEQIAKVILNKSVAHLDAKQSEKAIESSEEVIKRYNTSTQTKLLEIVAGALVNKGLGLSQLKQSEKAIQSCDEVISRFGESTLPKLQDTVAIALRNKGLNFIDLKQAEKAIECYEEVTNRFGESTLPKLQGIVARAFVSKGHAFRQLKQVEKAIESYDEVITRLRTSTLPALQAIFAGAYNSKGFLLLMQAKEAWNDSERRHVLLSEASVLFSYAETIPHVTQSFKAILIGNKAYALWLLGLTEEAVHPLREALQLGGETVRDGELEDVSTHRVSVDAGFETLVNKLWAELPHKITVVK